MCSDSYWPSSNHLLLGHVLQYLGILFLNYSNPFLILSSNFCDSQCRMQMGLILHTKRMKPQLCSPARTGSDFWGLLTGVGCAHSEPGLALLLLLTPPICLFCHRLFFLSMQEHCGAADCQTLRAIQSSDSPMLSENSRFHILPMSNLSCWS